MSFLRSAGSRALAWRAKRSSILGSEKSPPVVAVARGVPLEELVGVIHEVERGSDDQLEATGVPAIREPGGRLERPVLDLDADLAPLLDHERAEVDARASDG